MVVAKDLEDLGLVGLETDLVVVVMVVVEKD